MKKERFKFTPAVYLILEKDNKFLLSRRFNTGYEDGNYSFVAGHLNGDETLMQAMIREAKEEIGIDIKPENLEVVHVMHRKTPNENEERIDFFIAAKKWNGKPKNMEPHKCDDLNWFVLNNLPSNVIPYIRQAIGCVFKNIFYSEYGW